MPISFFFIFILSRLYRYAGQIPDLSFYYLVHIEAYVDINMHMSMKVDLQIMVWVFPNISSSPIESTLLYKNTRSHMYCHNGSCYSYSCLSNWLHLELNKTIETWYNYNGLKDFFLGSFAVRRPTLNLFFPFFLFFSFFHFFNLEISPLNLWHIIWCQYIEGCRRRKCLFFACLNSFLMINSFLH